MIKLNDLHGGRYWVRIPTMAPTVENECFTGSKKKENILFLFNDAISTFLFTVIWKERNPLFNDALNTFYLRLYGVGHIMVKGH